MMSGIDLESAARNARDVLGLVLDPLANGGKLDARSQPLGGRRRFVTIIREAIKELDGAFPE